VGEITRKILGNTVLGNIGRGIVSVSRALREHRGKSSIQEDSQRCAETWNKTTGEIKASTSDFQTAAQNGRRFDDWKVFLPQA
jgi:hypothetical protein